MSGKSQIAQRATMKIAEEHASSAETRTRERSAYAAFPFFICKECWTVHMCALCYMYCYNKDGVDMNRKRLSCARIRFLNERALIRYHDLLENDPEGLKSILSIS